MAGSGQVWPRVPTGGFVWCGVWQPTTTYGERDAVSYLSGLFLATGSPAVGTAPVALYTATNLVINPSLETNVTGYTNVAGVTTAGSTAQSFLGTRSILATSSVNSTVLYTRTAYVDVTAGLPYAFQYRVRMGTAKTSVFRVDAAWSTNSAATGSSGTITVTTASVTVSADSTGWALVTYLATAPAGNLSVALRAVNTGTNVASGDTWYMDAFMIEQADAIRPYFDGQHGGGQWTGTAHASTSQRTAEALGSGWAQLMPIPAMLRLDNLAADPLGGASLFVVNGALKYRNTAGTVTTLAS